MYNSKEKNHYARGHDLIDKIHFSSLTVSKSTLLASNLQDTVLYKHL